MNAKFTQSLLIAVFLFAIAYIIASVTMDTLGARFENEKQEEMFYYTNTLANTAESIEQFKQQANYLIADNTECGLYLCNGRNILASAGNTTYAELAAEVAVVRPDSNQVYTFNEKPYLLQMRELDEGLIVAVYDMTRHETDLQNLWQVLLLCAILAAVLGGAVVFLMFQIEKKIKSGGDSR